LTGEEKNINLNISRPETRNFGEFFHYCFMELSAPFLLDIEGRIMDDQPGETHFLSCISLLHGSIYFSSPAREYAGYFNQEFFL
jgi:hypothetical protein